MGFVGILFLFGLLFWAFGRVSALEQAKAEMSQVEGNSVQSFSGTVIPVSAKDYIRGDKNAPITIIEYSDFECPQCQEIHPTIVSLLHDYSGKVRLIQRMFPLPQNPNAEKEAEAALCAGKIGGNASFWKYGDAIFQQTTGAEGGMGFPLAGLVPLAKELKLPKSSFESCLNSGVLASVVQEEKKQAENAGVNALPAVFIIGHGQTFFLSGNQPYMVVKAVIDGELASF
ncbi:MAG TPA: thioredoxin domain-containing protein [Candidatus Saccharimonadales bacterium]|nr:thioredoxin domain-containing protein [Candidatus Saccharimonadales bacterium]